MAMLEWREPSQRWYRAAQRENIIKLIGDQKQMWESLQHTSGRENPVHGNWPTPPSQREYSKTCVGQACWRAQLSLLRGNHLAEKPVPCAKWKIGSSFVTALADQTHSYSEASTMELVALKAAMVMPVLLLQKPHAQSRTWDHVQSFKRWMILWEMSNIE